MDTVRHREMNNIQRNDFLDLLIALKKELKDSQQDQEDKFGKSSLYSMYTYRVQVTSNQSI